MLYCTVMIDKRIVGSYNHSHKKSTKSFEKTLDIKHRIEQNSQLHSFTASQLHSFTASQLHSFTAEGKLCPNKTIKHKQIYSHKKPQRPQSVELRSTSQRNNRNVLRIGTIQSKLGEGRKPCSERGVLSLPKKTEGLRGTFPLKQTILRRFL